MCSLGRRGRSRKKGGDRQPEQGRAGLPGCGAAAFHLGGGSGRGPALSSGHLRLSSAICERLQRPPSLGLLLSPASSQDGLKEQWSEGRQPKSRADLDSAWCRHGGEWGMVSPPRVEPGLAVSSVTGRPPGIRGLWLNAPHPCGPPPYLGLKSPERGVPLDGQGGEDGRAPGGGWLCCSKSSVHLPQRTPHVQTIVQHQRHRPEDSAHEQAGQASSSGRST